MHAFLSENGKIMEIGAEPGTFCCGGKSKSTIKSGNKMSLHSHKKQSLVNMVYLFTEYSQFFGRKKPYITPASLFTVSFFFS